MKRRIHKKSDIEDDPALRIAGPQRPEEAEEDHDPASAGQAGDLEGLSDVPEADSESVEELVEEGQFYEAEVVNGVEKAADALEQPAKPREVPEDDVPEEYRGQPEGGDGVKE